ncbi:hypothetical protein [Hyphococcus sp.]|uniref:hypothetical protein n=1 Tax=Hyphococcus sp. TaxID=2038636 RepID=UPI00208B41EC|nr:MAG: hypothetical protein DHS20C04_06130 [Marinicaulis sp.]
MASNRELQELINHYGKALDAPQALSFCVSKQPGHIKACASDVKRGNAMFVENVRYQGTLLTARASAALRAIDAHAAATFPD